MKGGTWGRLEELFHRSLDVPEPARTAFLVKECGSDAELLREVRGLVEQFEAEPEFLEHPAVSTEPQAPARPHISLGQFVGPYKVLTHLGSGGMSDVYLAQDERLNRFVALKILTPAPAAPAPGSPRYLHEARASSALSHPGIVTVYDAGEIGDSEYIVTEFIEGITLRERLRTPIAVDEAIGIARQLAAALSAAHDQEIIHRDLKPENVMIRADGLVKILDFGLARVVAPQPQFSAEDLNGLRAADIPGGTLLIGSIPYMSPEQVRAEPADTRSDVFSLGAVFYEMVTGRRAFDAASNLKTLLAILHGEPAPIRHWNRRAGGGLVAIINKCLEKDPRHRYQTAESIRVALEELEARARRRR